MIILQERLISSAEKKDQILGSEILLNLRTATEDGPLMSSFQAELTAT
jgi:hypothetical protein